MGLHYENDSIELLQVSTNNTETSKEICAPIDAPGMFLVYNTFMQFGTKRRRVVISEIQIRHCITETCKCGYSNLAFVNYSIFRVIVFYFTSTAYDYDAITTHLIF